MILWAHGGLTFWKKVRPNERGSSKTKPQCWTISQFYNFDIHNEIVLMDCEDAAEASVMRMFKMSEVAAAYHPGSGAVEKGGEHNGVLHTVRCSSNISLVSLFCISS